MDHDLKSIQCDDRRKKGTQSSLKPDKKSFPAKMGLPSKTPSKRTGDETEVIDVPGDEEGHNPE